MSNQEIEPEEQEKIELSEADGEQNDIEPPEDLLRERTHEKIKRGLRKIGKTAEGSAHAFTELRLENANVTELYDILKSYAHLRKIYLADNMIKSVQSIASVPYLTRLDLTNNNIDSLAAFNQANTLEYLEDLNLSKNAIKRLEPIGLRSLRRLNLNRNSIDSCADFKGHATLEVIELRKNKLTSCAGIADLPSLTALYLCENRVKSFDGLKGVPQLKNLNLRKNEALETLALPLPDLPLINKLNFAETKLASLKEIEKLKAYGKTLNTLNVTSTPVAEEIGDPLKKETIMLLPGIKRFNKDPVEQEEVDDALKELQERREEEEKRRLEEEEARRLAEEEEAANKNRNEEQEEEQE